MGLAMEVITGFVTAPGAGPVAATMAAGNTLTIRNAALGSPVWLLNLWSDHQATGIVQLRSPKLHDNVRGIRVRSTAAVIQPYLPDNFRQVLIPQDTLIFEIGGSAVAGDIETAAFLVYYGDLPGSEGRFIDEGELLERMVNVVTVETSHVNGLAGGYSGEVSLTSSQDLLKANTDYALLGYVVNGDAAVLRLRGADTANLGLGGPGASADKAVTRHWFLDLSRRFNMRMIPVLNSANKNGILCDIAADENAITVLASWILAELAPARGGALGR